MSVCVCGGAGGGPGGGVWHAHMIGGSMCMRMCAVGVVVEAVMVLRVEHVHACTACVCVWEEGGRIRGTDLEEAATRSAHMSPRSRLPSPAAGTGSDRA